jgi:hypothetical protein
MWNRHEGVNQNTGPFHRTGSYSGTMPALKAMWAGLRGAVRPACADSAEALTS